jgi:hypothetical protein
MFGLPKEFDPSFLRGRTLDMVCFTLHQANLHFSDGFLVSVEGDLSLDAGDRMRLPEVLPPLYVLIDQQVENVSSTPEGTLSLQFKNGRTIHVLDSSEKFESYVISEKGVVRVRV